LYIDGWFQLNDVLRGKKKPGPSSEFLERAKKRVDAVRKKMEQKKEMTLDETVRWLENAGNQSHG
jgi:hypothetical protein